VVAVAAGLRHAEGDNGQLPQRHPDEADEQEPEQDAADRRGADLLQSTGFVGLLARVTEGGLDGDPADEDVGDAPGGEAGPGQPAQGTAVRDPMAGSFRGMPGLLCGIPGFVMILICPGRHGGSPPRGDRPLPRKDPHMQEKGAKPGLRRLDCTRIPASAGPNTLAW
jgi:hypothetical protein